MLRPLLLQEGERLGPELVGDGGNRLLVARLDSPPGEDLLVQVYHRVGQAADVAVRHGTVQAEQGVELESVGEDFQAVADFLDGVGPNRLDGRLEAEGR